jgi:hypothetical protein
VPLTPKQWAGKVFIAVLVAVAEVVLREFTRKKR